MIVIGIDPAKQRVHAHHGPADAHVAVPLPQPVNCLVDLLPLVPPPVIRIQGELLLRGLHQTGAPDADAPHRPGPVIAPLEQGHPNLRHFLAGAGRAGQLLLPAIGAELRVADRDLHHGAAGGQFPHPGTDALCQQQQHQLYIGLVHEIPGRGGAVANGFDVGDVPAALDRGNVPAIGEHMQDDPHFPQPPLQELHRALRQVSDGADPHGPELAAGGRADVQQVLHRQRIDDLFVIVLFDPGDSIRFSVVAAQLGCHLIVCHANAGRDAQLFLDAAADLPGDGHGGAVQAHAPRHVQPALIQAEGLHLVGVVLIDLPGIAADPDVLRHIRRQDHQIRTDLFGLPDGHAGFDPAWLCHIVGGEHDPVPLFLAAADSDRLSPQLRVALDLHGCVKSVDIAVQNIPHQFTPPKKESRTLAYF